jgi:hypothetical protein
MINDLDRLRRLEREIGPSADALNPTGHRGLLQVALPTAIAAALFAIALVAWPQGQMTDAEVPQTVGHARSELTTEESAALIREEFAEAEAARELLKAEVRKAATWPPTYWFNDRTALMYRSPWGPPSPR